MISFITFQYVLEVHDKLIEEYGGKKGILNEGLLRSAIEMPKAKFNGKDLHRTIFDKTAAYLFHITKNHPFIDGNKRTASMTAMIFFASNFKGSFFLLEEEYQNLILGVAKGTVTKKEVAKFFKGSRVKR
ncbi:MAG: type II toxin-antitoxin system death-on-curing family toxin [Chlamydiae bacterium CG10_big_fil_rev_8_21_14_0_10_35_9]|nr:MAG: type II toxin-antitoxin system death-on-curing family toxin [Chlamydiae bacterium CG10_big_fil_rev_8_21_14_0_10_35_9]